MSQYSEGVRRDFISAEEIKVRERLSTIQRSDDACVWRERPSISSLDAPVREVSN
jgi:hypothetical protein